MGRVWVRQRASQLQELLLRRQCIQNSQPRTHHVHLSPLETRYQDITSPNQELDKSSKAKELHAFGIRELNQAGWAFLQRGNHISPQTQYGGQALASVGLLHEIAKIQVFWITFQILLYFCNWKSITDYRRKTFLVLRVLTHAHTASRSWSATQPLILQKDMKLSPLQPGMVGLVMDK